MHASLPDRRSPAPLVFGLLLVGLGGTALALQAFGVDLSDAIAEGGWPLFVIIPGLALLAATLAVAPPRGVGFAVAGAVVTTVGALLAYQNATGDWESWAYAWALIPLAVGVALAGYGFLTGAQRFARQGAWLAVVAGAMFLAGAWFFGRVFAGELDDLHADTWWPVALVVLGVAVVVRGLLQQTGRDPEA